MHFRLFLSTLLALALGARAEIPQPTRQPLVRVVDFHLGEAAAVTLSNGVTARVKLLNLTERRDTLSGAVREARARVEVNGEIVWLTSANYNLPVTVAGVRIDCPVTRGYNVDSDGDAWGLAADARLRLWPAGSPLIEPETFGYPLQARWFATMTQMANEPTFADGGDTPGRKKIYYHYDLDFGGCEGLVEVVAATDGLVVSASDHTLPGYEETPVRQRYDVIYLLDDRGWYYRYSHFQSIDGAITPGATVKRGQRLGVLGKEGASGGWTHLHFGIKSRQPSGKWGTQEAYAFAWEAYVREQQPALIAVARPHVLVRVGEPFLLDGSKSWCAAGKIVRYDWSFSDGSTSSGAELARSYARPGDYSEILKITDDAGHTAYDFAEVHVIGKTDANQLPPTIHPSFAPSQNIAPGGLVTFKVRTFRDQGGETWNFGDGSPTVEVRSDGNADPHAPNGYAVTQHAFAKAGDYIVRVEHTNARGELATAHLWVRVGR